MTENEAIGQLKYMYKTCMDEKCKHKGQCDLCCESRDMAIKALEEIQQYRAIGTVEELKATQEKLQGYKNQMSIYAEQHKVILASDVLDMLEELEAEQLKAGEKNE